MKILITGVCGFVGSRLAFSLKDRLAEVEIVGLDNLSRRGSETNLAPLKAVGCQVFHGDVRSDEDVREIPKVDWIIDCAANPSVMAGLSGGTRQLVGHNLGGTLNLLEKCRADQAGLVLLSSSRVYSIEALNALPLEATKTRLRPTPFTEGSSVAGFSERGVSEAFPTTAPISIYGATKLASEVMALEYGSAFGFPVWINRCGVIAGSGQFGRIDQGIFSFWIYQWLKSGRLSYIGFGGRGLQVRDFLAPSDLSNLVHKQLTLVPGDRPRIVNVGGGNDRAMSLAELSAWCREAIGSDVAVLNSTESRPFDIPYFVTDSSLAEQVWQWAPQERAHDTLEGILKWAQANRDLLAVFGS